MNNLQTEAIVLHRTNYGEADRIINFLSPTDGKFSAIAKGVRKAKSKMAGSLELFAVMTVTVRQGRGDVGLLTSARLGCFYGDILKEYERTQFAYEALKQINRVTESVAEPDFYFILKDLFSYLDNLAIDWRLSELWFRLRMITLLGRGLNLAADLTGQPLVATQCYNFDFQEMTFVQHPSGQFTAEHIKLLRLASVKNPTALRHIGGLGIVLEDCLWLVRHIEI